MAGNISQKLGTYHILRVQMAEAPDNVNRQRGAVAVPSKIPFGVLGNGFHQIAALPHKAASRQLCMCTALAAYLWAGEHIPPQCAGSPDNRHYSSMQLRDWHPTAACRHKLAPVTGAPVWQMLPCTATHRHQLSQEHAVLNLETAAIELQATRTVSSTDQA